LIKIDKSQKILLEKIPPWDENDYVWIYMSCAICWGADRATVVAAAKGAGMFNPLVVPAVSVKRKNVPCSSYVDGGRIERTRDDSQ